MKNYIALFEYDKNEGYGVVFPDLPGLATSGDDYDDAYRMAHEALALHLEGLLAEKHPIPKPRTFKQIKDEWEDWADMEEKLLISGCSGGGSSRKRKIRANQCNAP